ncbi:hypothetical protein [Enterococcus casseliflavus]|uniref:hypothetical protein n=1 Tax=Enterococcus casseliflavus TaxID=37734 RepID=UPI0034D38D72
MCKWFFPTVFIGEAYEDYFVISDRQIFWTDVRHVEIKQEKKWFDIDYFRNKGSPGKIEEKKKKRDPEIEIIKNEYYQPFIEDD